MSSKLKKNFRKRNFEDEGDNESELARNSDNDEEEEERRLALEEVKFLQKQRCKKSGMPALPAPQSGGATAGGGGGGVGNGSEGGLVLKRVKDKNEGEGEKEELVLQDTFAQETAVLEEDPNMLRYVEQELAKKRGKNIDDENKTENDIKHAEDELYKIPDHLKVKKRNSEESSTQWTTGIAEIQLPIEFKLRNIEETEAAKKLLQEKRLVGRPKSESNMPSSYSADYFQRGRDYAEKLRREHPELYKDRTIAATTTADDNKTTESDAPTKDGGVQRRAAATDEFMLDKFRKRERHRMRR